MFASYEVDKMFLNFNFKADKSFINGYSQTSEYMKTLELANIFSVYTHTHTGQLDRYSHIIIQISIVIFRHVVLCSIPTNTKHTLAFSLMYRSRNKGKER